MSLTQSERQTLLDLARAALRNALAGQGELERVLDEADLTPSLKEVRGAFVTLKQEEPGESRKRLRGCIGTVVPHEALYQSVIVNARHAAVDDPRFSPLKSHELPSISVEVSILTPLRPVSGPDEIEPGKHGVHLEKGSHRAVFLPQVATERGWDTSALLEHLARKAGLPADEWEGARLQVFEVEAFSEDEADGAGPTISV